MTTGIAVALGALLGGFAAPASAAEPATVYDWHVEVSTDKRKHAGTNAKVHITLYGAKGKTSKIQLDDPGRNDFKEGAVDRFFIQTPVDIGKLEKIRIQHDNSGEGPGWYLNKVGVGLDGSHNGGYFHFYRWLAKNENDGAICLTQKLDAKDDPVAC